MELILALAIGLLTTCGIWLVLRPRTFQLIIGLSLLSYAVNLFLFSSGRIMQNKAPVIANGVEQNLQYMTDPIPQALVLTAIVIGFATTALFLVVVMAARGFNGNDHVDGTPNRVLLNKKAVKEKNVDSEERKETEDSKA